MGKGVAEQVRISIKRDFFGDPRSVASYAALMAEAFDLDSVGRDAFAGRDLVWSPLAYVDESGLCVASIETARLPLHVDGAAMTALGIRSVAVARAWRGRGLFRALMEAALTADVAGIDGPVLLYTSEPALYARFGFAPLAQHAFTGSTPKATRSLPSRRLSIESPVDRALVQHAFTVRTPVSDRCAMPGAASLFLSAVRAEALAIVHIPTLEAIVAYEFDETTLVLVDVVAPTMPPIRDILGAMPVTRERIHVLFPPDKLDYPLEPKLDDTGLMSLGPLPPAMRHPFMLPPTTEF